MTDKEILKITIPGPPVPASRPRFAHGHAYNSDKYSVYKAMAAALIHSQYAYWTWDIPPVRCRTKRAAYIKRNRYRLMLRVFLAVNVGDVDNYIKSVMDALQDSGVIANDSQIDQIEAVKLKDKDNPRLEIQLERI